MEGKTGKKGLERLPLKIFISSTWLTCHFVNYAFWFPSPPEAFMLTPLIFMFFITFLLQSDAPDIIICNCYSSFIWETNERLVGASIRTKDWFQRSRDMSWNYNTQVVACFSGKSKHKTDVWLFCVLCRVCHLQSISRAIIQLSWDFLAAGRTATELLSVLSPS